MVEANRSAKGGSLIVRMGRNTEHSQHGNDCSGVEFVTGRLIFELLGWLGRLKPSAHDRRFVSKEPTGIENEKSQNAYSQLASQYKALVRPSLVV
jgi:hypothetical protein